MTHIVTYWYRFTMIHYSKFNHRVPPFPPRKKRLVYTSKITMTATFSTYQQSRTPWEVFAHWPGRWWLQARWPLKWAHDITSVSSIVTDSGYWMLLVKRSRLIWWYIPTKRNGDSRNSQRAWAMAPGPTLLPLGAHFGAFKRRIPLLWAYP